MQYKQEKEASTNEVQITRDIEIIPMEVRYSATFQTGRRAHRAFYTMRSGSLTRG